MINATRWHHMKEAGRNNEANLLKYTVDKAAQHISKGRALIGGLMKPHQILSLGIGQLCSETDKIGYLLK